MRGLRQPYSNLSARACIQGGVSLRNQAKRYTFLRDRFNERVVAIESLNTLWKHLVMKIPVSQKKICYS